jgi:hypothetical protein
MKRLLLGISVVCLVGAAVAFSGPGSGPELRFDAEERNPVSHLRLNNGAETFQFAVISDRTGGHRPQVFSRAVQQINLMQPEFVVSVGDLIEGYTTDKRRLTGEWREFQYYVSRLDMPFFYVPGNHDLSNKSQEALWKEKFGRRYYHFLYKDVLFLLLNSEDPPGKGGQFGAEQLDYVKETLADNPGVRWIFVFLHKPLWVAGYGYDPAKNGWESLEALLKGRSYTVFAGHVHRYGKFTRNGQDHFTLATTGGGSRMRGTDYGEFDHIAWVTMKTDVPVIANVMLDGILREDLEPIHTAEEGKPRYNRQPTHPVRGVVTFEGKPLAGAQVSFRLAEKGRSAAYADAFTRADGSFILSTYEPHDGAVAGKHQVTVVKRVPHFTAEGKVGPNLLPARYASANTSGLTATVKSGVANTIDFNLKK